MLLKDMGELEELIAEMKISRQFDALSLEFIHTRAKGVLQGLQMLERKEMSSGEAVREKDEAVHNGNGQVAIVPPVGSENLAEQKSGQEPPPESVSSVESISVSESGPEKKKDAGLESEPEQEANSDHMAPVSNEGVGPGMDEHSPKSVAVTETGASDNGQDPEDDEDMLEEDTAVSHAGGRLGDSFLKEKSINDLITDQQKLEYKLSNRPVTSIQSAIGINDRFQYIRELFDGDNEKFKATVKDLDGMDNITDAVKYLRTRFRWKKNETSLQFVNLVKRRFIHE